MKETDSFVTDVVSWEKFRKEILNDATARQYLSDESGKCLKTDRISVADKPDRLRKGSPNDYCSLASYWWPDPNKPDGLPYVRRDGETNPEHYETDRGRIVKLYDTVSCLVLQSYVTGSEIHARHAGRLLRCWFLDPETRMNPHLEYAQYIPGICEGRGIGLIDTGIFCQLLDAIMRLPFNDDWTRDDLKGFRKWMREYLNWFLESAHGKKECSEFNNHGTWYDTQAVCFSLFCGDDEIARRQIENFTFSRLKSQIEPDGSQPHELARTLSMSYCTFNLAAFAILAQLARKLDIDLWNWKSPDGRAILPAIRWMIPYYLGEKKWVHKQIHEFHQPLAIYLLSLAAQGTGNTEFSDAADKMSGHPWNRISLWQSGVRKYPDSSK